MKQLKIGSLVCCVEDKTGIYGDLLADVYGAPLTVSVHQKIGLRIIITQNAQTPSLLTDELRVETMPGGFHLKTDPFHCRLVLEQGCPTATIEAFSCPIAAEQLGFHLWLMMNRLLLLLDRLLLHAAAVEYAGAVNLFAGHKGAGKSTLSVAIGLAGGKLLAEDHVVLQQQSASFMVSGCSSRMRLTETTEREFFPNQVDGSSINLQGTLKKQFHADNFFDTEPHVDRRPDRLFLVGVGENFSCRVLPSSQALLRLIDTCGVMLRFAKQHDYMAFLGFLAAFIESVETYELVLSSDLAQIRNLPSVLSNL